MKKHKKQPAAGAPPAATTAAPESKTAVSQSSETASPDTVKTVSGLWPLLLFAALFLGFLLLEWLMQ